MSRQRHYPGLNPEDPELLNLLKKLRYDLTDMQVKISEALRMAAAANLPAPASHNCPTCGVVFRSQQKLAEHLYVSHDGPMPEHWAAIEAMADEGEAA